jgi:hypothetical protein
MRQNKRMRMPEVPHFNIEQVKTSHMFIVDNLPLGTQGPGLV